MIAMRPINEQDVIDSINLDRFDEPLKGYIIMDDATYLGYALYTVQDNVTTILDTDLVDRIYADGIIRACIAAEENKGIKLFDVNKQLPVLKDWWHIFCKDATEPVSTDTIFNLC